MQRWALALAVFFAIMAAATSCEQELHHGWWPMKVLRARANPAFLLDCTSHSSQICLLCALLYSSMALPTAAIALYIRVSIILSAAFILMQHIILIDWGYTLSSSWGRRERWWLVALLLLSLSLIIGSFAWG
jgi:hypothetical protein